jgi:hypothetical protein
MHCRHAAVASLCDAAFLWRAFAGCGQGATGKKLEMRMNAAPETLTGLSIEWTGAHHSAGGDFGGLSTHVVSYETRDRCRITADGRPMGEARYRYTRLDDRMAIVIYHPDSYRGRTDVVLNAIFDFHEGTDRAVILAGGAPFAVADGKMRQVPARGHG